MLRAFFLDGMIVGNLNGDLAGPREYVNVAGAVNGHWTACNGLININNECDNNNNNKTKKNVGFTSDFVLKSVCNEESAGIR